jgi:hypothetical protein
MQQRSLVKQAWTDADLYSNTQLQPFLAQFEAGAIGCWSELSQEVRDRYADYKEQMLTPIWDVGNKILRLNLIRALNPEREDEVAIFQHLIQRPDQHGDPWELEALLRVARRRGILRDASASA